MAKGAEAVAASLGGRAVSLDVTDAEAVAKAVAEFGPFEIAVNNAGADQHAFFTATNAAEWQRLVAVNLFSVFAVTHAVLPGMQARKYGRIVSVVSEAARRTAWRPDPSTRRCCAPDWRKAARSSAPR
jgi:2-hydroxycyclohexanecarboxyl-CoA dehydrogenase